MGVGNSNPPASGFTQALARLGERGRTEDFNRVMTRLEEALSAQDSRWLNVTHGELARTADPTAVQAFDACMDLLCAEASAGLGAHVLAWRCMSLGVLVKKPLGLSLERWDDVDHLKGSLAALLGGNPDDIFVDPVVLTSEQAFDFGPLDAYRQAQLVRSRAGGVRLAFLENYQAQPAVPGEKNTEILCELVLNVAFRTERWATTDLLQALRGVCRQSPLLDIGARGQKLPLQLLDVAPPWSLYTQFLHSGRALRFGAIFRDICRRHRVAPADLQAWSARVDDPELQDHVRCGVTTRLGQLLGGVVETGLHDANLYRVKVNDVLAAMGVEPLHEQQEMQPRELLDDSYGVMVPVSALQWRALPRGIGS